MKVPVSITVNGRLYARDVEPRLLLVHFIRDLGAVTGTKVGCDTSQCGACTVLLDGVSAKSCTTLAVQADGASVTTIEGLAAGDQLHPLQESFWNKHGLQCGFLHARHDPGVARGCCGRTRTRVRPRFVTGSKATCAAVHRLSEHRARREGRGRHDGGEIAMSTRIFGSGIRRREDPRTDHRHRDLHRRHHASGDGARGDAPQLARPREDQAHRHRQGGRSTGRPRRLHGQRHRGQAAADAMRLAAARLGPEDCRLPGHRQGRRALYR